MFRKSAFSFLILTMILIFFAGISYADQQYEVKMDDLLMRIEIPSDMYVLTRDIDKSDPILSTLNTTQDYVLSLFETQKVYLNAGDMSFNNEIVVTMYPNNLLDDFNIFDDTTLAAMIPIMIKGLEDLGGTVVKHDLYQHNQAKFIRAFTITLNEARPAHVLQYYTIYDGKGINVTYRSYDGEISTTDESLMKCIVDSVVFEDSTQDTITTTTTKTYTDSTTNTTFIIPNNWSSSEFPIKSEYTMTTLSKADTLTNIVYYSMDIYKALSAETYGISRDMFSDSFMTKSDFANVIGIPEGNISIVTYNSVKYYKCAIDDSNIIPIPITSEVIALLHINNGYMYAFLFTGPDTNVYYPDFEAMMKSITYCD